MSELTDNELVADGAIPPDSFWDAISRTSEVAQHRLQVPTDLIERLRLAAEDLIIDEETLRQAAAGLIAGNLILQGPPGTGKTSLARALAKAFGVEAIHATAREDWTGFDVVGGQDLVVSDDGKEVLQPKHGWYTEAAIRCAGAVSRNLDDAEVHPEQATWLVIDELNRANMDRAFGELFSVLGTEDPMPFRLSYMPGMSNELSTSQRLRIIGTLNSFDKQFVNSLSLAIRRRFTFITVDIPPQRDSDEGWDDPSTAASSLAIKEREKVVERALQHARPAGDRTTLALSLKPEIARVFEEVEKVRYASESSPFPYLPIGTAALIDVAQLAIIRVEMDSTSDWRAALDWACAVKLAPLFETDLEGPEKLRAYADGLKSRFPLFARELARIEAAGLYAVP